MRHHTPREAAVGPGVLNTSFNTTPTSPDTLHPTQQHPKSLAADAPRTLHAGPTAAGSARSGAARRGPAQPRGATPARRQGALPAPRPAPPRGALLPSRKALKGRRPRAPAFP